MKKNRIQRLQEDMNEDLQKYLDEDMLDTTPKEKKESSFWMKCVALCLLCSYGIAQTGNSAIWTCGYNRDLCTRFLYLATKKV